MIQRIRHTSPAGLSFMALVVFCTIAWADPAPATRPATRPAATQPAGDPHSRAYWQGVVTFYGDEESGVWSLRLRDVDFRERATFRFQELWHFDVDQRRWVKLPEPASAYEIVPPKEKSLLAPPDSQVLVWLHEIPPMRAGGLWYAKWKVEDVEGATFIRLGNPRAPGKLPAAPKGMISVAVPLDPEHSQAMVIPDPRVQCVAGKGNDKVTR